MSYPQTFASDECTMQKYLIRLCLVLPLFVINSVSATTINYDFDLVVRGYGLTPSTVFSPGARVILADNGISPGLFITGSIEVDPLGLKVTGLSFSTSDQSFDAGSSPVFNDITVTNNGSDGADWIQFASVIPETGDLEQSIAWFIFYDTTGQALQSAEYPQNINLADFDAYDAMSLESTGLVWLLVVNGESGVVRAEFASFTRIVPLPASGLLMVSGLMLTGLVRKWMR